VVWGFVPSVTQGKAVGGGQAALPPEADEIAGK